MPVRESLSVPDGAVDFLPEARYNRIFVNNYHTDYLPVTFGFRW